MQKKQMYVSIFILMLCLVLPLSAFAVSNNDFEAMVKKAEERRVAIAQMMEASTVFILAEGDGANFSMGTGFIIKKNYVLTNAHVVNDSKQFYIAGKNFAPIQATLIKKLHTAVDDFALLKFNQPSDLPILSFNLSLSRTDKVSAWGYPYLVTQFDQNMDKILEGQYANLPPVVYTEGVVSAFVESKGGQAIIHSAAIAAGNSGGPLINTQGHVVGVNTWGASIEGDEAFVNASLPAHAAIKFLRSCNVEPTIAESTGPILTMQGNTPTQPLHANNNDSTSSAGSTDSSELPSYLRGNNVSDTSDTAPFWANSQSSNQAPSQVPTIGNKPSEQAAAQLTGQAKELYPDALAGDAEAQNYVGASYYVGDEAPELEGEAIYWLQKAVAQGNEKAMYTLGDLYIHSSEFKDIDKGLELLRKAAAKDPTLGSSLAFFCLRGEAFGVPRDVETGFKVAQKGADAGDVECIGLLAYAYAMGAGVERDEAYALELAQEAANADDSFAHSVLGYLHAGSEDLPENLAESLKHAKIAAEKDEPMGYGILALHFIIDNYPDLGLETALELAKEGAAHGDEVSQFAMALFSVDEEYGQEIDLSLAWAYLEMASRRNLLFADELRDDLASALSPQDLDLGKQYIDLWHKDWGL